MSTEPGRSCPLAYRYSAAVFDRTPDLQADTLYVVGGLYGNLNALERIEALFAAETGNKRMVFNGDFHWFDTDPARPGVKGFRDPSTIRAEAKAHLAKWEKTNAKEEEENARRAKSKGLDDDFDGFTSTRDPNNPED